MSAGAMERLLSSKEAQLEPLLKKLASGEQLQWREAQKTRRLIEEALEDTSGPIPWLLMQEWAPRLLVDSMYAHSLQHPSELTGTLVEAVRQLCLTTFLWTPLAARGEPIVQARAYPPLPLPLCAACGVWGVGVA